MNILFLVPSLGCGGAERQLVILANELGRRGHMVTIATFYSEGPRGADVDPKRVNLVHLKKRSRTDALGFLRRLVRLIRDRQPDILHGYLTAGNLAATAAAAFCPGVRLFWGVRDSNIDLKSYDQLTKLTRTVAPFIARRAERVIVNSKAGLEYASQSGYPAERLVHVPNGIDTHAFHFDPDERAVLRFHWGYANHHVLIGLIGRIDPMKDHETFLRAAALVSQNVPSARFLCAGGGSPQLEQRLRDLARSLGLDNVLRWSPPLDCMRATYSSLDILCSASSFGEGFPNVIGEAMACETRCIATDVGDSAMILGETGVVVPPRDLDTLAAALINECGRTGRSLAARERILQHFSVSQLADRTEALAIARTGAIATGTEVTSWRTH